MAVSLPKKARTFQVVSSHQLCLLLGDELTIDWQNILGFGKFNNIIGYKKKPFYSGAVMLRSVSCLPS